MISDDERKWMREKLWLLDEVGRLRAENQHVNNAWANERHIWNRVNEQTAAKLAKARTALEIYDFCNCLGATGTHQAACTGNRARQVLKEIK